MCRQLSTFVLSLALLLCTQVSAHMEMRWPYPLRSKFNPNNTYQNIDWSMTSPLSADGSDYPCKGYHINRPRQAVTTYTAGSTYNMSLAGSARHNGGSCQLSLSYDNGATFTVIKSIVGSCPLNDNYDFTIPADAPAGKSILFAWTWQNLSGNREFYMGCAEVDVIPRPVSRHRRRQNSSFSSRPDIWKANMQRVNNCSTTEGQDTVYPNPGPDASYSDGLSSSSPATPGECDARFTPANENPESTTTTSATSTTSAATTTQSSTSESATTRSSTSESTATQRSTTQTLSTTSSETTTSSGLPAIEATATRSSTSESTTTQSLTSSTSTASNGPAVQATTTQSSTSETSTTSDGPAVQATTTQTSTSETSTTSDKPAVLATTMQSSTSESTTTQSSTSETSTTSNAPEVQATTTQSSTSESTTTQSSTSESTTTSSLPEVQATTTQSSTSGTTTTGSPTYAPTDAPPCPSTSAGVCALSNNNDVCASDSGRVYDTECGTEYEGTVIEPRFQKRDFRSSFAECQDLCDLEECVGLNYIATDCTVFSVITGSRANPNAISAAVLPDGPDTDAVTTTTSIQAESTTTTSSSTTGSTTESSTTQSTTGTLTTTSSIVEPSMEAITTQSSTSESSTTQSSTSEETTTTSSPSEVQTTSSLSLSVVEATTTGTLTTTTSSQSETTTMPSPSDEDEPTPTLSSHGADCETTTAASEMAPTLSSSTDDETAPVSTSVSTTTTTSSASATQTNAAPTGEVEGFATGDVNAQFLPCVPGRIICTSRTTYLTCDWNDGSASADQTYAFSMSKQRSVAAGMVCLPARSRFAGPTEQFDNTTPPSNVDYRDDREVRWRPEGACKTNGELRCTNGGSTFSICDHGGWIPMGSVAPGTTCQNGNFIASS